MPGSDNKVLNLSTPSTTASTYIKRSLTDLYVGSLRNYPARMPALEYPQPVHLQRISQQGSWKWKM